MALSVGGNHPWAGEVTVAAATIGEITNATTEVTELAVPEWIDSTYTPNVTVEDLDSGLIIANAWVDSGGVVKVAIGNITANPITPAGALTFKVVIL